MLRSFFLVLTLLSLFLVEGQSPVVSGQQKKWHKITIEFTDDSTYNEDGTPNPFLDRRLDVTFISPSAQTYVVPGYFAADGNAAETSATSGNKWQVNFSPNETGVWTFSASFREGSNVAVTYPASPSDGSAGSIDGQSGNFTVTGNDKTGIDLRAKGRLMYDGTRYPKFTETGEAFLKAGADSPENLLAFSDFDNTTAFYDWSAHSGDWVSGDPQWQGTKGRNLIGAINYLSGKGMNSFSFLPMNVLGDGKDVWPWKGGYLDVFDNTANDIDERRRYDVSKLAQWEIVFLHGQEKGMFLHFKLQEEENDQLMDGGALGTTRKLYCRELIARFGHHLALNWNIGEENTQTTAQVVDMMQYIRDIDPYDHLIVLHTKPNDQILKYTPLLGSASEMTGVSLQIQDVLTHDEIKQWIDASAAAGKQWVVANDEQGLPTVGVATDATYSGDRGTVPDNRETVRDEILYGTLMAGGWGVEYYFGASTGVKDLDGADWRSRDVKWDDAKHALDFFNTHLPFTEMAGDDTLVTDPEAYCFAKINDVYVVYTPDASVSNSIDLGNSGDTYTIRWYDPRSGGSLQNGSITSVVATGGNKNIGTPPNNTSSDWLALIENTQADGASISIDNVTVAEGGQATLTVTLDTAVSGGFTVDYATQDDTAEDGTDYTADTGTLTFSGTAGEQQQITISTTDDTDSENDEFFFVNLSNATASVTIADSQGVVTITDNDNPPSISIADITISEGDDAIFTVSLDKEVPGGFTVDFATSDGSALDGSDYTTDSGTLTFSGSAGEDQTITITTLDDAFVENNEQFTVTLSNPSEAITIDDPTATATITDNDVASTISINNVTVSEGSDAVLVVTLDDATAAPFSIDFSTQNSTATSGSDYTTDSGILNFSGLAGETQQITISTIDDLIVEGEEQFFVNIENVVGASVDISDGQGTITITDTDTSALSINDITVTEGGNATFSISLTNAVDGGFSVDYVTQDDAANAGSDYLSESGTVSFSGTAGETRQLSISTVDDLVVEVDEQFFVNLSNIAGTLSASITLSDTQGAATINDNDSASIAIDDVVLLEGGDAVFTISLNNAVDGGFSVDYATQEDTALAGLDFTSQNGSINFMGSAGETQQLTIATLDDALVESNEQFFVNLSNPTSGVTLADAQGTATLNDGDSANIFVNNVSVMETGGTAIFMVTLTNDAGSGFTIDYSTADDSAVEPSDYEAATGTLTFNGTAGETQQISINITDDSTVEDTEQFFVNISNLVGATVNISGAQGRGTITDNDTASITISDPTVTEGEAVVFSVTLTNSVSSGFSVDYATSNSTAIAGSDFANTNGTLNFSGFSGEIQTINVGTTDDTLAEQTEQFYMNLSNLTGGAIIIQDGQGLATIEDNDTASLTLNNVSVTEGENAILTVTLDRDVASGFTVDYATANNTAQSGSDYTANSGSLSFAGTAGETQQITISTIDDSNTESVEQFFVTLSNVAGAPVTLPDPQATVTLTDNDTTGPSLRIDDVSVTEGQAVILTVTLTNSASGGFSVDYATVDDSALAGSDYDANSGTLSFNGTSGEQQEITLGTIDDVLLEDTEVFFVDLDNITNGAVSISKDRGTVTLLDNDDAPDAPPSISISDAEGIEGDVLRFVVTLDKPSTEDIRFTPEFTNQTTTDGDYDTSSIQEVTLLAGETETILEVALVQDDQREEDEIFLVGIGSVETGALANLEVTAQGTIQDRSVVLYPVPFRSTDTDLTIDGLSNGTFFLALYNMSGQLMLEQQVEVVDNTYTWQALDILSNGTYLLTMENPVLGESVQKRFVVAK